MSVCGTVCDVPTPFLPSHGTGWAVGCRHEGWYSLAPLFHGTLEWDVQAWGWYSLGCSHSVPSFPWYIGMGWTVGCRHDSIQCTLGWQAWRVVQFGMFPLCPFLPMVHWDGMDMKGGTVLDVPTLALPSHVHWDGMDSGMHA